MKAVIICITDGGFRCSELMKATWEKDIDLDEGVMLAKSYKGKQLHVRPVFMTERMKKALAEWKEMQGSQGWIREKPDCSLIIGYDSVRTSWGHIRKKIGREDLRLHDLRHCFAVKLSDLNVPIADISAMLGHSNTNTTQIYLNLQNRPLRRHAERLNEEDE
jgi:integrase